MPPLLALLAAPLLARAAPASLDGAFAPAPSPTPGVTRWTAELPVSASLFLPGDHRLGEAWAVRIDGTPLAASGDPERGQPGGRAEVELHLPTPATTLTIDVLAPPESPPVGLAVGTAEEVHALAEADAAPRLRADVIDAFAAGFYLFTGLYHLQLYRRRPAMRAYAWFAAVCLGALTVDVTGLAERHIGLGSIRLLNAANGASATVTLAAMLAFGAALVERRLTRLERWALAGLLVAGLGWVGWIASPIGRLVETAAAVSWIAGLALFVAGIGRAAWRGHPEARLLAGGCALFGGLLALGIAAQAQLLRGVPTWLPIPAFGALILSMALSLADRFERAHRELDGLRADLERRVEERTSQLEVANAQLEGFNQELHLRVQTQVGEILKSRRLWRYFPRAVVQRLLDQDDATVRTERARLTVMFTDLTGFTVYSDGADPEAITRTLNAYLEEMVGIVEAHGGVVDKVMGDGIMAIWGAPEPMPAAVQAERATMAGVEMQRRMQRLLEHWRGEGITHPFRIRIGVHQDLVAVGSIGSDVLRSFTAIGSGVNLASRLEGACPPGGILISAAVALHLGPAFVRRGPIPRALKGVREPVETWEVQVDP